ncbi:MAG: response regulator [Candidatus Scalinduaceae bacterium]
MKKKILIIDDEETIRFTIKKILSKEGYEVSTANGYYEAFDIMARRDFDLIFTDLMLEDKIGLDVLREVKKINPICPVILNTGNPDVLTESESMRLGASYYLPKPVTKDTLLHIVNMVLNSKITLNAIISTDEIG